MPCQISPALSWLIRLITLLGGATGFYCPGGYLARHPRRASDAAQSLSRRPVSAEEDRDVGVHVSRRSKGGRETIRCAENSTGSLRHSSRKLGARPSTQQGSTFVRAMCWEELKFSDRFGLASVIHTVGCDCVAAVLAARNRHALPMRRGNAREEVMAGRLIGVARAAYQYPLLIKQLLHAPMVQNPDQQIV